MSNENNKALVREFMERSFNSGDLSVIDEQVATEGIDHQEPLGTDFAAHLKAVVSALRTAFPDLHFQIHHMVAEGEIVAFHSTMTGTHTGTLQLPNMPAVPATGRSISVTHMHFVRMINGKSYDLWHVWDTPTMLRQLGVMPVPAQARPA
jgi:steroid delta-isomerase-like uncharacterized protein